MPAATDVLKQTCEILGYIHKVLRPISITAARCVALRCVARDIETPIYS